MKPTVAADEMFPEGAGPFMDLEEGSILGPVLYLIFTADIQTNNSIITATYADDTAILSANVDPDLASAKLQAGGPSNLLMDLAANEKAVHVDFFNDFEDLFDDEDLK